MSRSGYTDDCENLGLWRGAVSRALNGKRGQAFLRELLTALDAMPEKRLITEELVADGAYCTLGVIGAARGLPLHEIDYEDPHALSQAFLIAPAMAQEIEFMNDEGCCCANETSGERWVRMRKWVVEQLNDEAAA